jgi:succinate-acetate transporter protein
VPAEAAQLECTSPAPGHSPRISAANADNLCVHRATYYFFGGLLLLIASLLEYFLHNAFPSVVFASYGAFFLSFAGTLTPAFAASASYAPAGADAADGLSTRGFNASFG